MSPPLRRVLQTVLTVGGLAALVWWVDGTALVASLHSAQWTWVGAAALLLPLNLGLDGWVWHRLLRPVEGSFSRRAIVRGVLSGLALGFWTPARAGEYAGRAVSCADADPWTVSVSVFVQRMIDMLIGVGVGLLLLLGAFWTGLLVPTLPWMSVAALGFSTVVVLGLGLLHPLLFHRAAEALDHWDGSLTDRTAFVPRLTLRNRAVVLGGSLARYLVFTTQFALLGLAFAPSAAVGPLAVTAGLTFFAKYLIPSLTLLDLGIREGSAVFFFQAAGLSAAAGLNAALLLFAINVLLPAAVGVPVAVRLSFGASDETSSASTKFFSIPFRS